MPGMLSILKGAVSSPKSHIRNLLKSPALGVSRNIQARAAAMVGRPYGAMWSIVKIFLKGRSVQTHSQAKIVPAAVARRQSRDPRSLY
jgi:hypothetical protein